MLCEKCSNIVLRPHPSDDEYLSYQLHDTFRLLRLSAQTCHLCRHVCRKLDSAVAESEYELGPIYIIYWLPVSERYGERPFAFDFMEFQVCLSRPECNKYCQFDSVEKLVAIDETCFDVPETFEPAQTHDNSLFSARTIQFAKQRMSHCSRSHPTCNSSASLPLWVIEISGNGFAAKLVPGTCRVAHYVALSYKWGEVTRYTMTTANRSSLQHGIPISQLPKTFSDAIELTYKLGHTYLWIDALCITQDDSRELGEQIAAMEDVYSGSDLTIFAAGGGDANWGLNRTRDATMVYPIQVKGRAKVPWLSTTVFKTLWIADALKYEEWAKCPLYQRGWVLQEQLLSRRGLVFNSEYVSWRCLRDNVSEILPFDCKVSGEERIGHLPRHLRDSDDLALSRNWLWAKSTDSSHKADFPLEPYYKFIDLYMRRTLTFESDVLPAISGLVAKTEQRTGSKFYYGTCLQDARGFLWVAYPRKGWQNGSKNHPSWSWTSSFGLGGHFVPAQSFDYTWQVAKHHNTRNRGELETVSWTQWGTIHQELKHPTYRFTTKMGVCSNQSIISLDPNQSSNENEFTVDRPVLCIFIANNNETPDYVIFTEPCHGEEDTFVRIGLATYTQGELFNVAEAVERQGAVMNSQRETDNPQRTIQYLV